MRLDVANALFPVFRRLAQRMERFAAAVRVGREMRDLRRIGAAIFPIACRDFGVLDGRRRWLWNDDV